jgi:glutathione peroxidase-family protein
MIKRIIFIALFLLPVWLFGQQGLYDISFLDIKDNSIAVSAFSGKKIVIAVIDAANPDEPYLRMLDTLCRNNNATLQVIAVPVTNFGNAISNDSLAAIGKRQNLGYIISKAAKGKKEDAAQQSLLNWVSHISLNKHFDNDIEEPGQLFVISEEGILYAQMKRKILPTGPTMKKIISQRIGKP